MQALHTMQPQGTVVLGREKPRRGRRGRGGEGGGGEGKEGKGEGEEGEGRIKHIPST